MTNPKDITTFHTEFVPDENPWVHGAPPVESLDVVTYDTDWPERFERLSREIKTVLKTVVLRIDHIGSTAVPGLAAKPVIDIDLIVADPTDESAYVSELETLGYDLTVREPGWYQHRCLRLEKPRVNLHVFGPHCPEHIRHLLFRDWLRTHPEERRCYEQAKIAALDGVQNIADYNLKKQSTIHGIYTCIFNATGML